MTDEAVEVDVNCAEPHAELYPVVLSTTKSSIIVVRLLDDGSSSLWNWVVIALLGPFAEALLHTLAMDLRAFTPRMLDAVKEAPESIAPYAKELNTDLEAVKWLRAPSLYHGPIAAVIPKTDERAASISVLLPRGVVRVGWIADMEVLPTWSPSPSIRAIQITSMIQQSATPAAQLLKLIGASTKRLSVRHSLFRGPNREAELSEWWKAVFIACPSIDAVTYDEISVAQAFVLVRVSVYLSYLDPKLSKLS